LYTLRKTENPFFHIPFYLLQSFDLVTLSFLYSFNSVNNPKPLIILPPKPPFDYLLLYILHHILFNVNILLLISIHYFVFHYSYFFYLLFYILHYILLNVNILLLISIHCFVVHNSYHFYLYKNR